MLQEYIRKLLLRCDPERAHAIGQQLIRWRYSDFMSGVDKKLPKKPVKCFGLYFPNPVGLAAGWDKDGRCIDALFRMGFGFVEVGTVTPKAQAGNPKPRLFRLPEQQALVNRMGFNNAGVDALVKKLKRRKVPGMLGVNIGKNKSTPLENALDDYNACLAAVYPYANYCVVNISSPNTPGLRELQSQTYLKDLLGGIHEMRLALFKQHNVRRPILVKTTVDLPNDMYQDFLSTVIDAKMDGLIISNTTVTHSEKETGGLSGAPLRVPTTQMIKTMRELAGDELPIVGVGGVLSGADAKAHWDAGASLLQLYTGFVYRGPALLREVITALK